MNPLLQQQEFKPYRRPMVNIPVKRQQQLIAHGQIKYVRQIDDYGRWLYTTITGETFMSTINPTDNHILIGRPQ